MTVEVPKDQPTVEVPKDQPTVEVPKDQPQEGSPPKTESVRTDPESEDKAETIPEPSKKAGPLEAVAHIRSTFNNTLVTISELSGRTLCWSSSGLVGFKGARKGTPYAAAMASEDAARKALDRGVKRVKAFIRGPGAGREAAVRGLQTAGLEVTMIRDVTPVPHNGCRAPKRRRV